MTHPDNFTFDVDQFEGVPVMTLRGMFRGHEACGRAEEELTRLLDSGAKTLVIHLGGVENIDICSLGTLTRIFIAARERGGRMGLAAVPENVAEILEVTKLDAVFEIYADSRSAVKGEHQQ